MSTVDRPVTQMTDTAVKRASTSGACLPELVAIGSEKSAVKTRMRDAKITMAKRAGLEATNASTTSCRRPNTVLREMGLARMLTRPVSRLTCAPVA